MGAFAGYFMRKRQAQKDLLSAEQKARYVVQEAEQQAEARRRQAELEAKDRVLQERVAFEEETRKARNDLSALEQRLLQREENLDRKLDILDRKEKQLATQEQSFVNRETAVKTLETQAAELVAEQTRRLERVAGLTADEARKSLVEQMRDQAKLEAASTIQQIENEAKAEGARRARDIVTTAVQRLATERTSEITVNAVALPSDDMKGRIIGREGRNIRALEAALGVDIIIDDTPEAVLVSAFDGVRRETARLAIERLVADGRVHPTRIEEITAKVKNEMEQIVWEHGEKGMLEAGVPGLHAEIVRLLGRLRWRTSYSQNVLLHSIEAAHLAGLLAAEVGADVAICRRGALLHDLGKAVSQEVEGPHALVGAEIARRFGESQRVVHCIAAHHREVQQETLEAILVEVADAISGARPGARRESMEVYAKRLKKLEDIANSFTGVSKSYAIQAGREVRIIVNHQQVQDAALSGLARDIAHKIEEEVQFPGQIKVHLIRETRAVEYAK